LYAVCVSDGPLPTISYDSIDAPPPDTEEHRFLEVSDIQQYVNIMADTFRAGLTASETASSMKRTSQRVVNYGRILPKNAPLSGK